VSGFVGVVNLDGAPVDRDLIQRMTTTMSRRGPDGEGIWVDGAVALGHTLLRTTNESAHERQPWSVDGDVWIAADVRLDARTDLVRQLKTRSQIRLQDGPDADLVLQAYLVWGEACVERLRGDFAFAIWDHPRRRLFCARDQLGVKPLFYAHIGSHLIVSNTLNCVRAHPSISSRLSEPAIAEFLAFRHHQDPERTAFADVQRLRPAHVLTCTEGAVTIRRYWTLPAPSRIRYRRKRDYVEHFHQVFDEAVADRLRVDRAGILMSGGMDSPSVAAAATHVAREIAHCDLDAFTLVFDHLIPDREREYATIAARALGMPIHCRALDDYAPFAHWDDARYCAPEPDDDPDPVQASAFMADVASHARVLLTGIGADSLFRYQTDVATLLRGGQAGRIALDVASSLFVHRRLPPLGIRTTLRQLAGVRPKSLALPAWIDPALVEHLEVHALNQAAASTGRRPGLRGRAQWELLHLRTTQMFESSDAEVLGVAVEMRHPFCDLRIIDYVLGIPAVPWSCDKELLRTPILARLPEQIRRRKKSVPQADPVVESCRDTATRTRLLSLARSVTPRFVSPTELLAAMGNSAEGVGTNLRPLTLEYWLRWAGAVTA